MFNEIIKEINRLEQEHEIKILYAVESGSRAWGFASTDSDWDVRFIYIHRPEWYLQIDDQKDNIEQILPNDIDLSGWEIKKALRLFRKSNPPLLEWLRSPIIYSENYNTAAQLRQLSDQYFNPVSCLHHYLHMAEGNYRTYLKDDLVRVKKYFYVLRPILACQWIEERRSMAPMEFQILVDELVKDNKLNKTINLLMDRKMKGEELNEEPKIDILNDYLAEKIDYFTNYLKTEKKEQSPNTGLLNELFRSTLKDVW